MQRLDAALAAKRQPPRQHLVERHPKAEDVAPVVRFDRSRLLGRHVGGGAHHDARRRRRHRLPLVAAQGPNELGQPEVDDLGMSLLGHHHVRGFDVPVHDTFLVRQGQPLGDLGGQFQGPRR
jgi:hypothetical protein